MSILNEARENTEKILDFLHNKELTCGKKPRDYREKAHKDFVSYTKTRRPGKKKRRNAIRKQLAYLKRNIRYINEIIQYEKASKIVPLRLIEKFSVIQTVYEQQREMYQEKKNRIDDRIVSLSQPHVRPIVRGKAGASVEFGAKISLSLCSGFSFVDHLSWDNFNESKDLIDQIEEYKVRYGYYPESVHADKIYQTRENRKYCNDKNIRITGKPLGRRPKETEENRDELKKQKKQRYQDDIDRIAIEGRFGVAKRKYGLGRIKAKLQGTSETEIYLSVLVMNLDKICAEEQVERENRYKILKEAS